MGRKPRSSASSRKQPGDPPSKPSITAVESLHPVIAREVKQARILLFRRKHHQEALMFIEHSISCHPNWGHLHLVGACIHKHLADYVAKDSDEKIKHFSKGARLARLAVRLLPNSLYCAAVLAGLLRQLAEFNEEWVKVNEECLRGLKIENSPDPGMDRFYEDFVMGLRSKESRIADERKGIIKILLSSKLPPEDLKKPFEEKINSKVEEDIKEMETRKKKVEETVDDWNKLKGEECKTSMRMFKGDSGKLMECESVWSAMSDKKKRGLWEVNIEELERHLESSKYYLAVECLREAIDFAKEHKTWKLWECGGCSEKFGNLELYRTHFRKLHWLNLEKPNLKTAMQPAEVESEWIEMIKNGVWKPLNTVLAINMLKPESKTSMDDQKWPLCDDTERAGKLERICGIYQLLLTNNCLERTHVDWPIRYTISEFESIIPVSQFRYHDMETLKVICLLGATQLKNILKFLKDLVHILGLSENYEMNSSKEHHESDIRERIVFSRDFSCLLLDERLLRGELNVTNYFDAIADNGSAVSLFADECKENHVLPYSNDILSWLYAGLKINEDLFPWKAVRDFEREAPEMVFQIFSEECLHLETVCDRISENSCKRDAVEAVYTICLEEIKQREKNPNLFNLLCKQQKDLEGSNDISSRIKSDIISNFLKDVAAAEILLSISGCQSGLDNGLRTQEDLKKLDNYIENELRTLKMQLLKDLAFLDAIVSRSMGAIRQYELVLEKTSFYDYRSIIVPLLKSFLQHEIYKDAREKPNTARTVILALPALDAPKKKKKKQKKNFTEVQATDAGDDFPAPSTG